MPGVTLDSVHRLLIADIEMKKVEVYQSSKRKIIKIKALNDKEKTKN